jgi:hypothetical protein
VEIFALVWFEKKTGRFDSKFFAKLPLVNNLILLSVEHFANAWTKY